MSSEAPQNLLTAGLWQTVGTLIASILSWLLVVIVSRPSEDIGLGAEGIGIMNTAFAFFSLFGLLTIGMSKATSQIVSEKLSRNVLDKREAFENARNGTFITILTGILVGVGLIITSFFVGNPFDLENELSFILFIIGIVMFILGVRDGLISNLAAVGEYDEIVKAFVTFPLFQVISGIILIILIKVLLIPVTTIVLIYIFGVAVQTLFLYKFFGRLPFNAEIFRFTQVDRRAFALVRQGFYFAITDIIPVGLLGYITTIILLAFTNSYEIVGAYSIVLGYSFGGLIVTGFAWPIITTVAEAYGRDDEEKIHYYLDLIVKLYFYITFLTLTINIGLSRGILNIFHGSVYTTGPTDVWIPFMLVIIAFAIAAFEYILCGILLGIGKGRTAAVYLGTIFLVIIGCSSLFIWLLPQLNASVFTSQLSIALGFLTGTVIMLPILPQIMKRNIKHKIHYGVAIRSIIALVVTLFIAALLLWPPFELIPLTNILLLISMAILLILLFPILLVFFGGISNNDLDLFERKMKQYGLEKIGDPLVAFFRKITRISPFKPIEE